VPAGWSLRQLLPWLCLLAVASTSAYGIQLTALAMVPSAPAARADEIYRPEGGDELSDHRAALVRAASTPSRRVIIVGYDATGLDQMQVECVTAGEQIATDTLLVESKDFQPVAAQVCNVPTAP